MSENRPTMITANPIVGSPSIVLILPKRFQSRDNLYFHNDLLGTYKVMLDISSLVPNTSTQLDNLGTFTDSQTTFFKEHPSKALDPI